MLCQKNLYPVVFKITIDLLQTCIFVTRHENDFLEQIFFEATTSLATRIQENFLSNKLWLDHYLHNGNAQQHPIEKGYSKIFSFLSFEQKFRLIFRPVDFFSSNILPQFFKPFTSLDFLNSSHNCKMCRANFKGAFLFLTAYKVS